MPYWDRLLWGVEMTGSDGHVSGPLGTGWDDTDHRPFPGEPHRPLLFRTKTDARVWCDYKHWRYADGDEIVRAWRFKPIRVRETVCAIRANAGKP